MPLVPKSALAIFTTALLAGCAGGAPVLPPSGLSIGLPPSSVAVATPAGPQPTVAAAGAPAINEAPRAQAPGTPASGTTGSGTSGSVTPASGTPIAGSPPSGTLPAVRIGAACAKCTIVAFKPAVVTLYMSEAGQQAERVPKSTLPLPIVAASANPASGRLQIMTLDGVRWVPIAEVQLTDGS